MEKRETKDCQVLLETGAVLVEGVTEVLKEKKEKEETWEFEAIRVKLDGTVNSEDPKEKRVKSAQWECLDVMGGPAGLEALARMAALGGEDPQEGRATKAAQDNRESPENQEHEGPRVHLAQLGPQA